MARKSRKSVIQQQTPVLDAVDETGNLPETRLATAAYARLSVDKGDEESLGTQIHMLQHFIDEHPDLILTDTYVDNGYTGTNFNRPEFIRLMEDIRSGKIQCIVVKDLSRFGRDFLETGYYLETLLPHLNVRFIAVNDEFDSSRESDRESIAVPIKNIVNEQYAKDFSKKAVTNFELHSRRGDKKIERSTYGYSLDKENNKLVVNPETAPYVQVIFRWFLSGHGIQEIITRLTMLHVMTPYAYKAVYEEGKPVPETDRWTKDRVETILRNRTYAGDTVYGKRRKILYKGIPTYHAARDEWVIHENTHEALIAREDFDRVQEMMDAVGNKRRKAHAAQEQKSNRPTDYFPRKVCCMECGNTMSYLRYSRGQYSEEIDGAFYVCRENGPGPFCGQKVHEDYLKIVVTEQIRILISTLCDKEKLLRKLQTDECSNGALAMARRKISDLSGRLYRSEDTSASLYESMADGIITEEEYHQLKEHYIVEQQNLKAEIAAAENRKRETEKKIGRCMDMVKHLEQYVGRTESDASIVSELVEKVLVSSTGEIEIRFCCDDVFKELSELQDGGSE